MDEARYRELTEKRDGVGLTDEEADELGRLLAEKSGETYGGAEERSASRAQADTADDEHVVSVEHIGDDGENGENGNGA